MLSRLLCILYLSLFTLTGAMSLWSQFPTCEEARDAPLCNLSGQSGTYDNPPFDGNMQTGLCNNGGLINNPEFYAFVAGSTTVDITIDLMDLSCTVENPSDWGIQVVLWDDCNGNCIGGINGGFNCYNDYSTAAEVIVNEDLTPGQLYYLIIDGCSGSVCTYDIAITATMLDVPSIDTLILMDSASGIIADSTRLCPGSELSIILNDSLFMNLEADYFWELTGPSNELIVWNSGMQNGTGDSILIDGFGVLDLEFPMAGEYKLCLNSIDNGCDPESGNNCIRIFIQDETEYFYGTYTVCAQDILAGFIPPDTINNLAWNRSQIIGLNEVLSSTNDTISFVSTDINNCSINQKVVINQLGTFNRVPITLELFECQLPYDYNGILINDFLQYDQFQAVSLTGLSSFIDFDGNTCDSIIDLRVRPIVLDTLINYGSCVNDSTEVNVSFSNSSWVSTGFQWLDSSGFLIGSGSNILLPDGDYFVEINGSISSSSGQVNDSCQLVIPVTLNNAQFDNIQFDQIDSIVCGNQTSAIIDIQESTEYSYSFELASNLVNSINPDNTRLDVNIANYSGEDISIIRTNSCGASDTSAFQLHMLSSVDIDSTDFSVVSSICTPDTITVSYTGTETFQSIEFSTLEISDIIPISSTTVQIIPEATDGIFRVIVAVVDINGCRSENLLYNVQLVPPLDTLLIMSNNVRCSSLDVQWIDIGAESYDVYRDGNLQGSISGTVFNFSPISSSDTFDVYVIAHNPPCPDVVSDTLFGLTPSRGIPPEFTNNTAREFCMSTMDSIDIDIEFMSRLGLSGSYTWATESGVSTNDRFLPILGIDSTYTLTVTYEEIDCRFDESIMVSIIFPPEVELSINPLNVCVGDQVTIEAISTANQLIWDLDDVSTATLSGRGPHTITTEQAGQFDINVVVSTDGCGDNQDNTVLLVNEPEPPIEIECTSDRTSILFTWETRTCALDYTVYINNMMIQTSMDTFILFENLGIEEEVTIRVEARSGCICPVLPSEETSCTTEPCPATSFSYSNFTEETCLSGSDTIFCITPTADSVPNDGIFVWQGDIAADGCVTPIEGQNNYFLSYFLEGCEYNDTLTQTFNPVVGIDLLALQPLCMDMSDGSIDALGIGGTMPYEYILNNGSAQSSGTFSDLSSGLYMVEVLDGANCTDSDTIRIVEPQDFNLTLTGPTNISDNIQADYMITTDAIDVTSIRWFLDGVELNNFSDLTSISINSGTNDFVVSVVVLYGGSCILDDALAVDVQRITGVFFPNVIAPDSDSPGDQNFMLLMKGENIRYLSALIYDRWGNLVYSDDNQVSVDQSPTVDLWNGRIDNDLVLQGVYVYLIEVEQDGRRVTYSGDLTVVK